MKLGSLSLLLALTCIVAAGRPASAQMVPEIVPDRGAAGTVSPISLSRSPVVVRPPSIVDDVAQLETRVREMRARRVAVHRRTLEEERRMLFGSSMVVGTPQAPG